MILADAGVDSGPILAQAAVPVLDDDDEESLHERIKVAERTLVVRDRRPHGPLRLVGARPGGADRRMSDRHMTKTSSRVWQVTA